MDRPVSHQRRDPELKWICILLDPSDHDNPSLPSNHAPLEVTVVPTAWSLPTPTLLHGNLTSHEDSVIQRVRLTGFAKFRPTRLIDYDG